MSAIVIYETNVNLSKWFVFLFVYLLSSTRCTSISAFVTAQRGLLDQAKFEKSVSVV